MSGKAIARKAIGAKSLKDAEELQAMIEAEIGNRFERPVGDRWKNSGMFSGGGGSYDHKIIENTTNMQDTVIELAALRKFGSFDKVPYSDTHEAAEDLFNGKDISEDLLVQFEDSDPPAKETKRISAIFRDHGCGMTPSEIPETILGLGSSHKEDKNWLQGAFGMGGKVTYRNSKAIVIVTRKAPDLLSKEEKDLISVAVLFWETHNKTQSLYYLVTSSWEKQGDIAYPFSISSDDFPEFEPGTHLALISYGVEGLYRGRGGGDDRTFEAIFNTRVFCPVLPIKFTNKIIPGREKRRDILKGLEKRLEDNPHPGRREGREILPYNYEGTTYHLPVSYFIFPKRGERRNFVAYDHAVVFTSNGQVHAHWTPAEFQNKTNLNKLYDRIFVEVETDELPIEFRTALFTMERTDMVKTDAAIKLENDVAGLLDDPDGELREINNDIIKEAILAKRDDSRPTINIARQISRVLKMKGFSLGAFGNYGGGRTPGGGGRKPKVMELYNDPTTLEGPSHIKAEEAKTKFTTYWINAVDDFIPKRGQLTVICDHPDINDKEITVGSLRKGRIKVSIAVPADADKGEFN